MILKDIFGIFSSAPKAAQNSPVTIKRKDGTEIVIPTSAFKKDGTLRVAVIKELKAAGINW